MPDQQTTVQELRDWMREFVSERQWERFHNPKNLAMGLAIEGAELMEHFLWLDLPEAEALCQRAEARAAIADELADVACYLLALANAMKMDLSTVVAEKMVKNRRKNPVEEFRGRYEKPKPK